MAHPTKKLRYDPAAAATAQYYNTTGTVPSSFQLSADLSYLITAQPNCTIAVFEIPPECTEMELQNLFATYGPVKNIQKVCAGRAALIEFPDISLPTRLVHLAKISPFYVGMSHVRLEFSSQTITKPVNNGKHLNAMQSITDSIPSNILHLDVTNADYPITVDVLKAICSPHGQIQRIFIGKINVDKSLEALIEFGEVSEAVKAREHLDGADIYSGCCSLTVTYSKVKKVHVTKNDTESWDFTDSKENHGTNQRTLLGPTATVSNTPSNQSASNLQYNNLNHTPAPPPAVGQPGVAPVSYTQNPYYGYSNPPSGPAQYIPPTVMPGGYYCQNPMMAGYPAAIQTPMGAPYYQHPASYQMFSHPNAAQMPIQQTTVRAAPQIIPTPAPVHHITPTGIGIGHSTSNLNANSISAARNTDMSIFIPNEGSVLMACNLPEGVNCDHLFNVLCLYGNIARVKFLKSRPGCAMIQMGSKDVAELVYTHLNGTTVFGQTIQFYRSKQSEVQEHAGLGTLSDGSPVIKNYMSDSNNRFRNPIVAAKSRILAPTRTLHFFNAPLNFSPEDMCRIFADCGVKRPPRIVVFTAKPGQKTSLGLAEWDTLPEALDALALSNHRPIHIAGFAHPFHLKLAFSPKPISDDRAGACMINYPAPPIITKEALIIRKPQVDNASTNGPMIGPQKIDPVPPSPTKQENITKTIDSNDTNVISEPEVTIETGENVKSSPILKRQHDKDLEFDIDTLEAEENAFLEHIKSNKEQKVNEIESNQASHTPPLSPINQEGLLSLKSQTTNATKSDAESPKPQKVHQPPATPPSEPEDE